MKVRLFRGIFLHLGTPWRGGVISFENPQARDWEVASLWGLSGTPIGFLGFMAMKPSATKIKRPATS